ncbi:hypothetical protein IAD21_01911 [Abditibacteriota bacterium]|nr:hypothetical protein IAD21_01911 [Abditibacteriota bacterium]
MKIPFAFSLMLALCLRLFSLVQAQPHDYQQFVPGGALVAEFHLQERCYGMSVVPMGDYIYLLGGDTPPDAVGNIERINTRTNTIETLDAHIWPRYFSCSAAVGEKIYIFGGTKNVNPFWGRYKFGQCFDTRTHKVTDLADAPSVLCMASAVEFQGKIYVVSAGETTLWIYDPQSDKWEKGATMRVERRCDVVLKDGVIYAIGGFTYPGGFRDSLVNGSMLRPTKACEAYDIAKNQWHDLPDLPVETSAHHLALAGDSIFAFGDYTDMDRILRFDLKTQTWRRLFFTGFDARYFPSACAVNNRIYVMGGKLREEGYYLDEVQVFDAAKLR